VADSRGERLDVIQLRLDDKGEEGLGKEEE
jgi:hypothetical protein